MQSLKKIEATPIGLHSVLSSLLNAIDGATAPEGRKRGWKGKHKGACEEADEGASYIVAAATWMSQTGPGEGVAWHPLVTIRFITDFNIVSCQF